MKLRKSGRTEVRRVERPVAHGADGGTMGAMGAPAYEEVEGELWEDLDGNVCAWTPKGSGVIAIEVRNGTESAAEDHYKNLKVARQKQMSTEERVLMLEQALEAALRRLAELERT